MTGEREAVLLGRPTHEELTEQLLSTTWRPFRRRFRVALAVCAAGTLLLAVAVTYTVTTGIGVWGNNIPVGWAFGIINFVWWIGIGHAGTFISAILLLVEQRWRNSINRFAEAMTLFAVMQAGLFPVLHLGRPWFAYWVIPYPATMGTWPQFKSPLPWDAAAISTYFTVSLLFFYLGLLPDLASLRDRAPTRRRRLIFGVMALGWRGSARHWNHWRAAYLVLAGLATPLVISVHSIVSTDFAVGLLPGWHSTIFPPFFVAGAVFNGFAMVLTFLIPARWIFGLENVITKRHLDNMAKLMLVTSSILTYAYIIEIFVAWYSGDRYEMYQFLVARPFGPASALFWIMIVCNAILPLILWSRRARANTKLLWVLTLFVSLGMWAERFVIIVLGLQRDFLPSSWHWFVPTWVDLSIFVGTIFFFSLLFLLFLRVMPFIPLAEMKELRHELEHEARGESVPHA